LDRTTRDARFGAAIASVRKRHRLNQSEIPGVSERQIRRIEQGSRPRVRTLEIMAKAHGLSLDAYLSEVAEQMEDPGEV
jgi:transcriptional regulator with XRE-family HTH domain